MSKTLEDILAPKPQARHRAARRSPGGPAYGKMLMQTGHSGPILLHVEYLEGNPKDAAVLKTFREAHLRDMKTLKGGLE